MGDVTTLKKIRDDKFPALEGVMDVEEGKLEDELVDNPGTTKKERYFL